MDQCRCTRNTATVLRLLPLFAEIFTATFVAGLVVLFLWSPTHAQAAPPLPPDTACKLCHVDTTGQHTFASGEVVTATVDLQALGASVHGSDAAQAVYCTDCHQDRRRYLYPHQTDPALTLDAYKADIATNCEQCHTPASEHNPGHLQAADNPNIPTCVDCHGGHTVEPAETKQADPIATCKSCHQSYDDPKVQSVHDEIVANLQPGQTCETCHASEPQPADAKCKTCHSLLTRDLTLPSGEKVSLEVHASDVLSSVHGTRVVDGQKYQALECTDCHRSQAFNGFPHPDLDATSRRELTVDMEQVCAECHEEIAQRQKDGVHEKAIAEGNLDAATCFDCHGNHAIQDPDMPRERVSQTCGKCHSEINNQYAHSVHGKALLGEDNPDVPVCTDCHGVHNIADPTTAQFRLSSPEMCGKCHADETKMAKYGISTDVFNTYVADFHGTTVELFDKQTPDQETNKAVCYDCHGIHNIMATDEEGSQVVKEHLLVTCQKCHPDAKANFPDAWTSHFKPSLQHNQLVYFVDLFYMILIPLVVSGFFLFIGTDIFRRIWDRVRSGKQGGKHKDL